MKTDRRDIPNDYERRADLAKSAIEKVAEGKPLQDIIDELQNQYEPNFIESIGLKIRDAWQAIKQSKKTRYQQLSLLISVIRLIVKLKKKAKIMLQLLETIKRKLKERSTYAGIATLLAAIGVTVQPDLLAEIGTALIGVIGVIEIVRKEKEAD